MCWVCLGRMVSDRYAWRCQGCGHVEPVEVPAGKHRKVAS